MWRRLAVFLVAFAAIGATVGGSPASAGAGCVFDQTSATATVTGSEIRRDGEAITVGGQSCEDATVTNTDTIVFEGSGDVVIDLRGGPFAPGATDEGNGSSEIEIDIQRDGVNMWIEAGPGPERIKPATLEPPNPKSLTPGVINLNAAEIPKDPDVTFTQEGILFLGVVTRGGNDAVFAQGHGVSPYEGELAFFGGAGHDRYEPGTPLGGYTLFVAGPGRDVFDISWLPRSRSLIYLGSNEGIYGTDDWLASLISVDELVGHVGRDRFTGSDGNDRLIGNEGRDSLRGKEGNDRIWSSGEARIDGGPGFDRCFVFPEVASIAHCEEVVYAVEVDG